MGDELFVVVDRRPLGDLTIDVYDTSEKPEQFCAVDEAPADPDPIGPEVLRSPSLSLPDLTGAADEEESEVEAEAVDWFSNLDRGFQLADVMRCMTLNAPTVDNSLQVDIIKVTIRVTALVVYVLNKT